MTWALLVVAGLFEVVWAIGLKYTNGFTKLTPSLITIGAMIISFLLLAHVMKTLPVGTAYVSWVGIGAIGAAIFGVFLFNEPVNTGRVISMFFIVAGVVGLKLSTNS